MVLPLGIVREPEGTGPEAQSMEEVQMRFKYEWCKVHRHIVPADT